jgi:DNA-directed RNA polymerase subunit M/transcription elongation factor TFIIS
MSDDLGKSGYQANQLRRIRDGQMKSDLFNSCPKCGANFTVRVRRSLWMRLFPRSIAVRCNLCGQISMLLKSRQSESADGRAGR